MRVLGMRPFAKAPRPGQESLAIVEIEFSNDELSARIGQLSPYLSGRMEIRQPPLDSGEPVTASVVVDLDRVIAAALGIPTVA